MEIVISNERVIERVHQLAEQLNQSPEQIIEDAIEQFTPSPSTGEKGFWKAIQGIGASGDPDLASRVKDILREETDPINGWSKPRDAEDTDR